MITPDTLAAALESSGIQHRRAGHSYVLASCPRCGKSDKLYVAVGEINGVVGRFKCMSGPCTADKFDGKPEFLFAELLGISVGEAQRLLGGEPAGCSIPRTGRLLPDPFAETEDAAELPDDFAAWSWPADYYPIDHPMSRPGARYLEYRGLPSQLCQEYGLRYAAGEGRVVFPVRAGGVLVGWQKRSVDDANTPTKLSSPALPAVWMFEQRLEGVQHALVGEGPIDALKGHLVGGNVASMGKGAIAPAKMRRLKRAGIKRVYLGLDLDAARETMRLVAEEGRDLEFYRLDVERERDLGAMTPEQVLDLARRAPRVDSTCFYFHVPDDDLAWFR